MNKRKIVTFSLSTKTVKVLNDNMLRTGVPMSRQIDHVFGKPARVKRLGEQ